MHIPTPYDEFLLLKVAFQARHSCCLRKYQLLCCLQQTYASFFQKVAPAFQEVEGQEQLVRTAQAAIPVLRQLRQSIDAALDRANVTDATHQSWLRAGAYNIYNSLRVCHGMLVDAQVAEAPTAAGA